MSRKFSVVIWFQSVCPILWPSVTFCNMMVSYGELLDTCPPSKLEDHALSGLWDYLLNTFTAAFYFWSPSPPSATHRITMQWWQKPTWHGPISN